MEELFECEEGSIKLAYCWLFGLVDGANERDMVFRALVNM